MKHGDGTRYEGEWQDNHKEGLGIEHYKDKSKFVGIFKMDEKSKGKLTQADGTSFEGTWYLGYKHGAGFFDAGDGKKEPVEYDLDRKVEPEEEEEVILAEEEEEEEEEEAEGYSDDQEFE
jgi:hypothetical protein